MSEQEFKDKMIEGMATIMANQANSTQWLERISRKVDKLETDGCTIGKEVSRRITVLESLPSRQVVGGSLAGGGIAAVILGVFKVMEYFIAK